MIVLTLRCRAGYLPGIDFEIDEELVFAVEGADGLCAALFAADLGPDLVVGVLSELAEAIGPGVVRDTALYRQRMGVLQVDDDAFERGVRLCPSPCPERPAAPGRAAVPELESGISQ